MEKEEYILISTIYENAKTKLEMLCPQGHVVKINWNNFKSGRRCNECSKKKKGVRVSLEEIESYVSSQGYTLLEAKTENYETRIKTICPQGHFYETRWQHFKDGVRCPKEIIKKRFPYEEVKNFVNSQGYQLVSKKYNRPHDKLTMICPQGHTCSISYHNFKNKGRRCGSCKNSKGEKEVQRVLEELNIEYITQYTFEQCQDERKLPFDIYVPKYNTLIEYDGIQHYEAIDFFGGEEALKSTQRRDLIKTTFCEKSNIELIRIPYWDYENIEKILKSKFI